jgi:16S rRNA processing protein RimM
LDDVRPGYVAVARVLGAWGARGAVKVDLLGPAKVLARGRTVSIAGHTREIEGFGRTGRLFHVTLSGVGDRETARSLRDKFLQVRESELDPLPPGEYYRFQLIGLTVRGIDGDHLGSVTDVLGTPENDVYVVNGPYGEVLIPAVDDVVRQVDLGAGVITVEIVPGLLP